MPRSHPSFINTVISINLMWKWICFVVKLERNLLFIFPIIFPLSLLSKFLLFSFISSPVLKEKLSKFEAISAHLSVEWRIFFMTIFLHIYFCTCATGNKEIRRWVQKKMNVMCLLLTVCIFGKPASNFCWKICRKSCNWNNKKFELMFLMSFWAACDAFEIFMDWI